MQLNIVLCEPEIPPNTGNISRTCAAIGAHLHLIHPLGFVLNDTTVKRAGLDYWQHLSLHEYRDLDDFFERAVSPEKPWYLSTKADKSYHQIDFLQAQTDECWLMFGKETRGLPESILKSHPDQCIRIPMLPTIRSLNLSNAVAILAYEVMRQNGFAGLATQGHFPENQ